MNGEDQCVLVTLLGKKLNIWPEKAKENIKVGHKKWQHCKITAINLKFIGIKCQQAYIYPIYILFMSYVSYIHLIQMSQLSNTSQSFGDSSLGAAYNKEVSMNLFLAMLLLWYNAVSGNPSTIQYCNIQWNSIH